MNDADDIPATILYNVYYFGDNTTNRFIPGIDAPMTTIDNLPAVDSDVNVVVYAINVFGSGPNSTASDTISKSHTVQVLRIIVYVRT